VIAATLKLTRYKVPPLDQLAGVRIIESEHMPYEAEDEYGDPMIVHAVFVCGVLIVSPQVFDELRNG